ncbi:hypothetical protein R5R73_04975 [Salinicola sp. LHM]|uniref:hypothetical protein n=1 Tax=Salinicola sp. LHM TaxID=3065298 RepID=UPI002ACD5F76|nr:hypothetical protein [Salinicola sp. LHM]WQH34042.1 hypothetical protein R5R73_04975 [Salinicola sp. LHM]
MTTIYELGDNSIWTGRSRTLEKGEGRPRNWTTREPPVVPDGQMAQLRGHVWVLIESVPESDHIRAMEKAREQALERLNAAYNAAVAPLVKTYPITEIQSWTAQEVEADAYQTWVDAGRVGDAPATPKLNRILAGRNGTDGTETLDELVEKVRAKVALYSQALDLMGRRQRGENLIVAAETVEAVQAVTWEGLTPGDL